MQSFLVLRGYGGTRCIPPATRAACTRLRHPRLSNPSSSPPGLGGGGLKGLGESTAAGVEAFLFALDEVLVELAPIVIEIDIA